MEEGGDSKMKPIVASLILIGSMWGFWNALASGPEKALEGQKPVWLLTCSLSKGDLLTSECVGKKSVPPQAFPPGALEDPGEVIGMRAVRAIRAGAVLRKDQFRPEPILRKGQKVEIVLEAKNLRIVAPGQSLEDGGQGESIRVLNTSSRQVIVARVVDGKRVVVDF